MQTTEIKLKKKAALISLIIGFLMFIGKFGAYLLTGSASVLSDALESVVHIIATSFAYYSLILSTKPPDTEHPYGHGKVEFFSAGFEGALIGIAAISIMFFAIKDIILGSAIGRLDTGVWIIAGAGITNLLLGLYLVRTGKKTNSIVLVADGKHVLTDSYTSFGVIAALILVLVTGIKLFDPIIAIIIAINILWTGKNLVRQSIGGLMNETSNKVIEEIAAAFEKEKNNNPTWIDIHRLRYWKSGDKYMVDFHLTVPYYCTIQESHEALHKLEGIVKKTLNTDRVEILIHMDPCIPSFCKICRMENCNVRSEPKQKDILWDRQKIVSKASYVIGDMDDEP
jgi:cation diffusion facilitator family transporter